MKNNILFITGTDTNIGKTYIGAGLLRAFKKKSLSTVATKPIASDCFFEKGKLFNKDALMLKQESSIQLDYDAINPFTFKLPIAAHLAAQAARQPLTLNLLQQKMMPALQTTADIHVMEGIGGWHVLLNEHETFADFISHHQCLIILVVGIRLGCINHALLSARAILQDKGRLIGWIGNCIDPEMNYCNENIETLQHALPVPCFGVVKHNEAPENVLDVKMILDAYFNFV
ncbi:MAG: dethiobiotin synthase [Gammaproteobacteria bacterium RIFCSPHIGHO2_12_FULL_38_14]|nr:MAG: dethiobiotin synthase [Gammaproteobacteria bacterium RIFCSPHIGHO2_12_FULL_38_14]